MALQPNARATPEGIRRAIQRNPEGPIVLWRFASLRDPQHLKNKEQLNATCAGPGDGVIRMCGTLWKLCFHPSASGGGFAILERLPQEQVSHRSHRRDPRQWWHEQLIRKGYLDPQHSPRPAQIVSESGIAEPAEPES